jgi:iron(III) transport system substrate-binding protein
MVKGLAAVVLASSLAAGGHQGSGEWQKIVEGAKREGSIVLYSALVGAPSTDRIAKAFETRYGIPVETLEARASELMERVRTEQASGRALGDVSYNGATATERQMLDGVFVPHGPLPGTSRLTAPFTGDGTRVPAFVIHFGILVNTELLKASDRPRAWKDLLDPKWKGQILADDVHPVGSGSLFFQATCEKLGRAFHDKLAAQDPSFTRDPRGSQRRVARGEYPIFIPSSFAAGKELDGLPLETVVPEEGVVYVVYQAAVFKSAPHPNAARLFMDFLLSDEVQRIYASDGYGPVVEAVQPKTSRLPLLGTSSLATMAEMATLAREIYK